MIKSLKIISILLAVIMAFSFLTIPVRAEALMAAAAAVVLGLAVGAIAELSAGLISQAVESGVDAYQDVVSSCRSSFHNLVQDNNSILVSYRDFDSDTTIHSVERIYPNSSLTGDELEIAHAICDAINNSGNIKQYLSYNAISNTLVLTTEGYEQMKKQVVNAWLSYVREKAGKALQEDVGVPTYDFDFVGPIQGATFPSGTTRTGLQKGDFYFTSPIRYNGTSYMTKAEAALYIPSLPSGWYIDTEVDYDGNVRVCYSVPVDTYSSVYVIYNNTLYYYKVYSGGNSAFPFTGYFSTRNLSNFVSKDGVVLSTLVSSESDIIGLPVGECYNIVPGSGQFYPDYAITDDDFNAITGGGSIDIPLTEDEAALVGGLGFGLLNRDSLLDFNADGSLASADGIPIDKLQQILEALQNGTLEFDDIQSYLQTMSTLIANGNLTASEQQKLLENINANIATISKALEMEASIEVDKPDIDYSALIVEHTGLAEAKTIVETALPVVGQAKVLLDNLFAKRNTDDYIPKFAFYWDSDGDGISEKYTVLDLSFMEQTLTNTNLTDKKRFTSPITIRQFVQHLIILITYTLFAIKVLKKIPGLIGGVESAESSASTIDKYNSKV